MCGRCSSTYYVEMDRHLKVKSGEHIGILTMAFEKTKLSKEIAICDTLFRYSFPKSSPSWQIEIRNSCLKSNNVC